MQSRSLTRRICEYLEDRYPSPAVFPSAPAERVRARWLEEYADTRKGEVFIWRLFIQVAVGPHVWGVATDAKVLERTLTEEVPHVLDYLESELPATGVLFSTLAVADIAIAALFRNALFARLTVDQRRWPITAAYVERMLALPSFRKLAPVEEEPSAARQR